MKSKELKKEQMKTIRNHLKQAEAVVMKKHDYLSGKREELGEDVKEPKDEAQQIMVLVRKMKEQNIEELGEILLALEVDTRQLEESIAKEKKMVDTLETDAKGTSERDILKEIDEELELATHIEHQINLLASIQNLSKDIINKIDTDIKDADVKEQVGSSLTNLNNIASFLLTMINEEELPELKFAYNTLQMIERPEAQKRLGKIRSSFENIQPNLL
jgi:hypothetical protein